MRVNRIRTFDNCTIVQLSNNAIADRFCRYRIARHQEQQDFRLQIEDYQSAMADN